MGTSPPETLDPSTPPSKGGEKTHAVARTIICLSFPPLKRRAASPQTKQQQSLVTRLPSQKDVSIPMPACGGDSGGLAGPPQPSPEPGREQNRVLSCLPPLAGGLRGVLGSHTQPRRHCRTFAQTAKKLVGCYADSTADKIRIGKDFGLDPDFICVEVCAICGPSGVLPVDTPF